MTVEPGSAGSGVRTSGTDRDREQGRNIENCLSEYALILLGNGPGERVFVPRVLRPGQLHLPPDYNVRTRMAEVLPTHTGCRERSARPALS